MDSLRDSEFTEAELAHLNSGGQIPLPAEPEPEPAASEADAVAEAPAEAPAEADPDVDGLEEEDDSQKGRKVGYRAYLRKKAEVDAARIERDQLREKYEATQREMAAQNARIEERFRMLQAAQQQAAAAQQPQQPVAPPPNPEEDPLGALKWQNERLAQLERHTIESAQRTHQTQAIAQLDNTYRADGHQAAREVPEYPDAYNHLVQRAEQAIRVQNPQWTHQQVNAEVERQERMLAQNALQRGMRPAALILQMAAAYGWTPRAQEAQAAPQPDPSAEQAKLDAVARGQAQNRSLSSAGRPGASSGTMTADRFVNLSDEEAREWLAKNPDGLARLSGGR